MTFDYLVLLRRKSFLCFETARNFVDLVIHTLLRNTRLLFIEPPWNGWMSLPVTKTDCDVYRRFRVRTFLLPRSDFKANHFVSARKRIYPVRRSFSSSYMRYRSLRRVRSNLRKTRSSSYSTFTSANRFEISTYAHKYNREYKNER